MANYVPPCRPSRYELDILSTVTAKLAQHMGRGPNVLILGSTTEYRDWAFENHVTSLVVDNSPDFHRAVSLELTHAPRSEFVDFVDWRDLNYVDEFDIVVGDLVVGQVPVGEISLLLERISNSLRPGGTFLAKSFFGDGLTDFVSVVERLKSVPQYVDPFPLIAHELVLSCLDPSTQTLSFARMHERLADANAEGMQSDSHMSRFKEFGWDGPMKIDFTVPNLHDWKEMIREYFDEITVYRADNPILKELPYYALSNRDPASIHG